MTRLAAIPAFLITLAVASAAAIAVAGGDAAGGAAGAAAATEPTGQAAKAKQYEAHDLFIETNASAGDAGLQGVIDAENWKRTKLLDTKGRVLVDLRAKGLGHVGLSELFYEAAEPPFTKFPFSKFKKKFPEGKYRLEGRTANGRKLASSMKLSHLVPDAPVVTFPTEGSQVDPHGFTIRWNPVTTPAGVDIAGYIVTVSQGDRELSMELEASATSATVPGEFLKPGTDVGGEVLSKDRNGNQTITALPSFKTK